MGFFLLGLGLIFLLRLDPPSNAARVGVPLGVSISTSLSLTGLSSSSVDEMGLEGEVARARACDFAAAVSASNALRACT